MTIPFSLPSGIIFLVGMPGCGKSTIGKKLAEQTNRPFFDSDEMIENDMNLSIAAIFSKHGENFFRNKETEILQNFPFPNKAVVALGGGTPCFNNNIALLKKKGSIVYLKTDTDILVKRLSPTLSNRPLLKNQTNLHTYLTELLTAREPFYLQADIIWLNACV